MPARSFLCLLGTCTRPLHSHARPPHPRTCPLHPRTHALVALCALPAAVCALPTLVHTLYQSKCESPTVIFVPLWLLVGLGI
jgi:hypothetical protein